MQRELTATRNQEAEALRTVQSLEAAAMQAQTHNEASQRQIQALEMELGAARQQFNVSRSEVLVQLEGAQEQVKALQMELKTERSKREEFERQMQRELAAI